MNNYFNEKGINFTLPLAKRLFLFLCVTVLCFVLAGAFNSFIVYFKGTTPATMRIAAVIQDIFAFIIPAILTAILITRLPARFLCVDKLPSVSSILLACFVLLASIPAMNALVTWNESINLPESLSSLEQWMRDSEESSRATINMVLGTDSISALLLSIAIVGIFAGLSEELFFRGAFQRLLSTGGLNSHLAIWIVAFVFSASHLQFYGFFGRLLLGAFFGYLLFWSKSLWLPIIIHVINNTLYILSIYLAGEGSDAVDLNNVGVDSPWIIVLSVLLTAGGLALLRLRYATRASHSISNINIKEE